MLHGNEQFNEKDLLSLGDCGFLGSTGGRIDTTSDLVDMQELHPGFGSLASELGTLEASHIAVDIPEDRLDADGYAETPMMEFSRPDFEYLAENGTPYPGMLGVCELGDLYQYKYDGNMGGLFSRIRKGIRKVRKKFRGARKRIKKRLMKTRFGKAVVKIAGKVHRVGKRVVSPFRKMYKKIGPEWMARLAPLANAIPGVGPVISTAMAKAGTIGHVLKRTKAGLKQIGVVDRKTGKPRIAYKIDAPNPRKTRYALMKAANKFAKKSRRKILRMANRKVKPRRVLAAKRLGPAGVASTKYIARQVQEARREAMALAAMTPRQRRQHELKKAKAFIAKEKVRKQKAIARKAARKKKRVDALLAELRRLGVQVPA